MADQVDELLVELRVDGSALRREVAALKGELEGPLGASAARAGQAIEGALLRAVRSGKLGFDDLKRAALAALADIARGALAQGLGALGGSGQGLNIGSLLSGVLSALLGAPGRATGGPVTSGRPYLVGERGPELFVPTSSGRVEASFGKPLRGPISITVNVTGGASEPQRLVQSGRQVARAVRRALADLDD